MKLKFENPVFREGMQQTIRKGEKPVRGWVFNIMDKEGKRLGQGSVYLTEHYRFRDLPDNVVAMSHDPQCRTKNQLYIALQQYYPGFTREDIVTVVWFKYIPKQVKEEF
jgi:hypothetical protein